MSRFVLLWVLTILTVSSFPQVNGISNSKCFAPNSATVEKGVFEFEPAFSVFRSSGSFNNSGRIIDFTSDSISSDVGFRITLGIADDLEIGTSFAASMGSVNLGLKYKACDKGVLSLSMLAGIMFPAGNKSISDSIEQAGDNDMAAAGAVATIQINENTSLDAYCTYSKWFTGTKPYDMINFGLAFGTLITEKLQPVIEINGISCPSATQSDFKLFVVPGFTYTFSPRLLVICGMQYDTAGKNEAAGVTYFSCFTISFK